MGAGDWMTAEKFQSKQFHQFLVRLEEFRENLAHLKGNLNGTPDALTAIEEVLHPKQTHAISSSV